ncbi:hypothetical protein [Sphingobium sp. Z007]|uniref:hypothetical protein n=1 Tax=Sphingobium sp. Z007 TaxID=627495 RepID=UPI0015950B6E|nr:hypothetical protein [Sphingobium sp. Z007]
MRKAAMTINPAARVPISAYCPSHYSMAVAPLLERKIFINMVMSVSMMALAQ